jgi:hypothetical protein
MNGAILPLSRYASWRGAQLKKRQRDNFIFAFTFSIHQSTLYADLINLLGGDKRQQHRHYLANQLTFWSEIEI